MSKSNLPDLIKRMPVPKNPDPRYITELQKTLVNAWREVRIVEEQEKTKREAIQALKEVTMKKLDILEKNIDKTIAVKMEIYKDSAYRFLELIDQALASGDNEKLKYAVTGLIKVLDMDLFEGIDKIGRALRGEEVDEIEL